MYFFDKIEALLKRPIGQKPTQQQVDNLYRKLDQFVEQSQREAFEQNQPLLIVIGEQHSFAHNSVLIESMLLDIAKRRGISNLFYENTADYIKNRLDNPPSQYLMTMNDIDNPWGGSISYETIEHAHKNSFRIIPTEVTVRGPLDVFKALREKEMVQTMAWDSSGSALAVFGADHLKAICEDSMLNSKFLVRPINTVPFEFSDLEGSRPDIEKFTFHSDKVAQFRLGGDIFHTKPSELLRMASKADASFVATPEPEKPPVSPADPSRKIQSPSCVITQSIEQAQTSSAAPRAYSYFFFHSLKTMAVNTFNRFLGTINLGGKKSPVSQYSPATKDGAPSTIYIQQQLQTSMPSIMDRLATSIVDYATDVRESCPSYFPAGHPTFWREQAHPRSVDAVSLNITGESTLTSIGGLQNSVCSLR